VCLDIDSRGNPHIAYNDLGTGHLIYGSKRNGQWTFMPVPTKLGRLEPGGVVGYDFKLHFRNDTPELHDTPHFIFHDASTGQLGYTRRVGGTFKVVTAAASDGITSRIGLHSSIAFDRDAGAFRLAYIEDFGNSDDSPSLPSLCRIWTRMIVDPFEGIPGDPVLLDQGHFDVVRPTSIASNSLRYCLAFPDATNRTLVASFSEPGISGQVREVVAETHFPVVPSVTYNSHGQARIAYADDNGLLLISRMGNQWVNDVVDPDGAELPSIACHTISPDGHVAYQSAQSLKYAKWTEPG
jgi:hypothetical protein